MLLLSKGHVGPGVESRRHFSFKITSPIPSCQLPYAASESTAHDTLSQKRSLELSLCLLNRKHIEIPQDSSLIRQSESHLPKLARAKKKYVDEPDQIHPIYIQSSAPGLLGGRGPSCSGLVSKTARLVVAVAVYLPCCMAYTHMSRRAYSPYGLVASACAESPLLRAVCF